jgi:hypothetical protein
MQNGLPRGRPFYVFMTPIKPDQSPSEAVGNACTLLCLIE